MLTIADIAADLPADAATCYTGDVGDVYLLGRHGGAYIDSKHMIVKPGVSIRVVEASVRNDDGTRSSAFTTTDGRTFRRAA